MFHMEKRSRNTLIIIIIICDLAKFGRKLRSEKKKKQKWQKCEITCTH